MPRSAKATCSSVCGAKCCKWGVVGLTEDEAERLPALAHDVHVAPPRIIESEVAGRTSWAMHAQPCVFLSKSNLCIIYKDRPGHCRAFPDTWREGCLLSWSLFGDDDEVAPPQMIRRIPRMKEGRTAR